MSETNQGFNVVQMIQKFPIFPNPIYFDVTNLDYVMRKGNARLFVVNYI